MNGQPEICELCGCSAKLTKHHLVPKVKAKNKYKGAKNDESNFIWICRPCHDQVHALWDENELRDSFSTKDKIMTAPEMAKFIAWRMRHPEFDGHSKMSNRRK